MKNYITLSHSFDLIVSLLVTTGILLVVQTFVIGHHYIIPTGFLTLSVIFGNLAYYGFKEIGQQRKFYFGYSLYLLCIYFLRYSLVLNTEQY